MDFRNSTELDSARLEALFLRHTHPYRHDRLTVRVRFSHGAEFSGTCFYANSRIFVNLGRQVHFPYRLATHIARSQSDQTHWWRETYRLVLADGYQLALFVYLHELYHYLVKASKHNPRRKESMCDRFATRALVTHFRCHVVDRHGQLVPRAHWDFQDVDAFVAAAPKVPTTLFDFVPEPTRQPIPVRIAGMRAGTRGRASRPRTKP
jgi:hypothetical protein